jgi:outer membrane protein assembly factor BamB
LSTSNGELVWQAALAEGTDLQLHSPPIGEGVVAIATTLSHPLSAPGNLVFALDPGTGQLKWSADLGGTQGFHQYPSLIADGRVFVKGPDGVVALDVSNGELLWEAEGYSPLAIDQGGVLAVPDSDENASWHIDRLDGATGAATPVASQGIETRPMQAVIRGDQLLVTTDDSIVGLALSDGAPEWSWRAPYSIVDLPAVSGDLVAVPTADQSVVVLDLP